MTYKKLSIAFLAFIFLTLLIPTVYSSTASKTGTAEFQFTASKAGYESDIKKVAVSIEAQPSIKVLVNDLNANAIGNARVYLDNSYAGDTDSYGIEYLQATKGAHEVKVTLSTGELCSSRNVTFGGQTEALFNCCNVGYECKAGNTLAYRNANCSLTHETTCEYGCDSSKKECMQKFEPQKGTCDCSLYSNSNYSGQFIMEGTEACIKICPAIAEWSITTGAVLLTTLGMYMITQLSGLNYSYYGIPKYDWDEHNLNEHYNDHGWEFEELYIQNIYQYRDRCKDTINSKDPLIETYKQPANPSKGYAEGYAKYDPIRNIYVVGDTLGQIITCYRPKHPDIKTARDYVNRKITIGDLIRILPINFIGIWEAEK